MSRPALKLAFALVFSLVACGPRMTDTDVRVVILGFDGVDPDLVRELMDEGLLPNLKRVADEGAFTALGTTIPPESPVAWASFHTGTNPGKHGIYDFVRRDPETYYPQLGTLELVRPKFLFNLFQIEEPDGVGLMRGEPFWMRTANAGIRTIFLQAPLMFPAPKLPGGFLTSGLTTPDIRGTQATFHFFSTDISGESRKDTQFGGKVSRLEVVDGRAVTRILGPWDPLVQQKKAKLGSQKMKLLARERGRSDAKTGTRLRQIDARLKELEKRRFVEVPLNFSIDRDARQVGIELQGHSQVVAEATWSDWLDVTFSVTPIMSIRGIVKFYPLRIGETVEIYMSPIEMDPRDPPLRVSYPRGFSNELAEAVGLYKPRGWAAETSALMAQKIDEKAYLDDQFELLEKREAMTLYALENKDWSLFISVLSAPDRTQHMFWRLIDPIHPMYDAELAERYGDAIRRVYVRMDETVGKVVAKLPPETKLLVMSDHGFHSYRRGMNINTWLVENGLMTLKGQNRPGTKTADLYSHDIFFRKVDWSKTKAYALGLGLIFVNIKGREAGGIVEPGEQTRQVKAEITSKLLNQKDPDSGEKVVDTVYDAAEVYSGDGMSDAPDLIVGFADGYRVNGQTALGAVPPGILVVNDNKWSGDHCSVAAETTSGFLITNQLVTAERPHITDIAPTILKLFAVEPPEGLDGRPLW